MVKHIWLFVYRSLLNLRQILSMHSIFKQTQPFVVGQNTIFIIFCISMFYCGLKIIHLNYPTFIIFWSKFVFFIVMCVMYDGWNIDHRRIEGGWKDVSSLEGPPICQYLASLMVNFSFETHSFTNRSCNRYISTKFFLCKIL